MGQSSCRRALLALLALSFGAAAADGAGRLEGLVVNAKGEPVEGASVSASPAEAAAGAPAAATATTDGRGTFKLDLPPGTAMVSVFKTGYEAALFEENVAPGETHAVRYQLAAGTLAATVVGTRLLPQLPAPDRELGRHVISRADVDRAPGAMEDVARVLATLPGVVADPDLLATFYVRGGGPEEVGTYLDSVPLQNPFHLGGFASVFNPMLIDKAEFWAGVTPPRFEPALSGALDVRYATGETTRLRAEADLSMQTAKARVDTPTGIEGLSALVAYRRSFFELYFAGLRAAHVISGDYVAPDLSELFARLNYNRGSHHVTLSYMRATDGFSFQLKPGEEPLFGATDGLVLSNRLQLGLLQDRITLGASRELLLTAALTDDTSQNTVSSEAVFSRDVRRLGLLARADLTLPLNPIFSLSTGLQIARQRYDLRGELRDERGVAPWASTPLVETYAPALEVSPQLRQDNAAVHGELRARPLAWLSLEAGARLQALLSGAPAVYAVRAAASAELPTGTLFKLEGGVVTQQPLNPLLLDSTYGNPSLSPERSRQLLVGVEQLLPQQILVRVEGFLKWLDHLAVNPDSDAGVSALVAAGEPVFQSTGSGTSRGIDFLILGRAPNVSYGLSGGLVFADRHNPLASGLQSYPAPWDQRFTLSGNVSVTPGAGYIVSARGSFHTGRPYTPVIGFQLDGDRQRYLPIFGDTNSARYSNYFDLSLRLEKRFTAGPLRLAWYAELLNVTNATNIFALTYDRGDPASGKEPVAGAFNHLPIRPFLGVRGEY